MIYPSDFGYASASTCSKLNVDCGTNWLLGYGWTVSPCTTYSKPFHVYSNNISTANPYDTYSVRPSVYLISDIQMKGSGTTSDPYVFAE